MVYFMLGSFLFICYEFFRCYKYLRLLEVQRILGQNSDDGNNNNSSSGGNIGGNNPRLSSFAHDFLYHNLGNRNRHTNRCGRNNRNGQEDNEPTYDNEPPKYEDVLKDTMGSDESLSEPPAYNFIPTDERGYATTEQQVHNTSSRDRGEIPQNQLNKTMTL